MGFGIRSIYSIVFLFTATTSAHSDVIIESTMIEKAVRRKKCYKSKRK